MDGEPNRAWWRKKRWWLAAAFLFAASYPLSLGPVMYASGRGWAGDSAVTDAVYAPLMHVLNEAHRADESAEASVEVVTADGRTVTAHGRSETSWWAPAVSTIAHGYWAACCWCGDAGSRHAQRAGH